MKILFSTSLKATCWSSGSKSGHDLPLRVAIFPGKENLTQLWGYYKIVRLAKYARFEDIEKWVTYGAPFTLIGARDKPGLTSAIFSAP